MSQIQNALTQFILNPKNHDLLAVLKGARNGLVYGTKIRFPHALVMVFLFGSGTPREKFSKIITATRQHALRLCMYVALYKAIMMIQRDLFTNGKEDPNHPFVAGLIAGGYMFGERTPVNEQIVLYCVGRCIASLLPRAEVPSDYPAKKVIPIDGTAHKIFAAVTWGTVMWLFVNRRQRLNGGLIYMCCQTNGTVCAISSGIMSKVIPNEATWYFLSACTVPTYPLIALAQQSRAKRAT